MNDKPNKMTDDLSDPTLYQWVDKHPDNERTELRNHWIRNGVMKPAEQNDRYAVLRTDGEDIDREYVGFFQYGLQDAQEVAATLGEECDDDCECEFAVFALVRVHE